MIPTLTPMIGPPINPETPIVNTRVLASEEWVAKSVNG